jgi:hypothetical protein
MERAAAERTVVPERCVIVLANDLPVGRAANAAAVIALTVGQRHPGLVGAPLIDASAVEHPGLIPIGITVLAAASADLASIRDKGLQAGCDLIDFPAQGQQTTSYAALREAVAQVATSDLRYVGVALVGPRDPVRKIVGTLLLLK